MTRVLQLRPGRFLDPLQGDLVDCHFLEDGSSIPYTALSYVWGDPAEKCAVFVNGNPMAVPANLGRALRQIRSEHTTVAIWADAICINQADIIERASQVAIMLDIYSAAARVFAWLGPETEHTAVGMQVLKQLLKENLGSGPASWESLPANILRPGIADVTERQYFQRMWVSSY